MNYDDTPSPDATPHPRLYISPEQPHGELRSRDEVLRSLVGADVRFGTVTRKIVGNVEGRWGN